MATILVIDDEPGIRGLLATVLERKGYDVLLADNGSLGLELCRRKRPDLVVLDLKMPGIDGRAVLRQLRDSGARLPVIVFTGVANKDITQEVISLGAASCIDKEFSLHRLGDVLKDLLPAGSAASAATSTTASRSRRSMTPLGQTPPQHSHASLRR